MCATFARVQVLARVIPHSRVVCAWNAFADHIPADFDFLFGTPVCGTACVCVRSTAFPIIARRGARPRLCVQGRIWIPAHACVHRVEHCDINALLRKGARHVGAEVPHCIPRVPLVRVFCPHNNILEAAPRALTLPSVCVYYAEESMRHFVRGWCGGWRGIRKHNVHSIWYTKGSSGLIHTLAHNRRRRLSELKYHARRH